MSDYSEYFRWFRFITSVLELFERMFNDEPKNKKKKIKSKTV